MTPVTLFANTEAMYKGLHELLASHPEYKHFDNGTWRIVEIPPQQFPPINEVSVFILMQYHNVDVWDESDRWLAVASDGEHPDGYDSLDEALQVLRHVLSVGDRVRPKSGCVAAGQIGKVTEIMEDGGYGVEFGGSTVWIYDADMLEHMCPLCPQDLTETDDDQCFPISNDFFGGACQIDGTACCETCYNVYQLTNEEIPLSCKQLWKTLYGTAREKGYGVYCGYHSPIRDFAITGHADGWPSVWSADRDGLERATYWLSQQGPALPEEKRKLIESLPDDFDRPLIDEEIFDEQPDEESNCDDHAYDVDTYIPVIRNWNDEQAINEAQSLHLIHQNMEGFSEENDDPNLEPDFTDSPYGLCSEEAFEE